MPDDDNNRRNPSSYTEWIEWANAYYETYTVPVPSILGLQNISIGDTHVGANNMPQSQTVNNEPLFECVSCFHKRPQSQLRTFYVPVWGIGPMPLTDFNEGRTQPFALSPRLCCNECWCPRCNVPVSKVGSRFINEGEADVNHNGITDVRCKHSWCKTHGRGSHFSECRACGNCNEACNCFTCNSCGERRSGRDHRICEHCDNGSCCCRCYQCSRCYNWFANTRSAGYCEDCNACQTCCQCAFRFSSIIMGDSTRLPYFHDSKRHKGRFISTEIEIAGSDPKKANFVNEAIEKWAAIAVEDGSLPVEGYEINTAPAKDEMFDKEITEICDALKKANAIVTKRCGLHVHLDARDMTYYDLRKILQVYWAVEDDMFSMLPASRRDNRYCLRVKRDQGWSDVIHKKLSNKMWREAMTEKMYSFKHDPMNKRPQNGFRKRKYEQARYYALNLHSWFYRKTIEFRHHHGTADKTKIINWARICESVVDFAMKHSEREIRLHFANNVTPLASILNPVLKDYFLERQQYFRINANDVEVLP